MHISRKEESQTKIKLLISASEIELSNIKKHVLKQIALKMKLPGFRQGKAPLSVIEKQADQNVLHAEFIDEAINRLYQEAIKNEKLRPVDNPKISLKKFVPFSELEFEAIIEIVGKVELPKYKNIKKIKDSISVNDNEIEEVINSLKIRSAKKSNVTRVAKEGDEVILDFYGSDSTGKAIKGAEGKDYPLLLGSNTFIPGFEDNITGMKPGEKNSFVLTFPKNYGVQALANKKVTFTVHVKSVQELKLPKIDDKFASNAGPFKTVRELKADIKKQLEAEKHNQANRKLENEIIQEVVLKSKLELPKTLVDEQIAHLKNEIRQNLIYRGQTWEEMLENEGLSEDKFIEERLNPEAENRVKTGLVLAEISLAEGIEVSPEELEVRMQILKSQYNDPAMLAELEKPEARRDIASRLLTEKTVQRLVEIASKNN